MTVLQLVRGNSARLGSALGRWNHVEQTGLCIYSCFRTYRSELFNRVLSNQQTPRDARAPVSTALPSLGRVRVASTWSRSASTVVDRVVLLNEGRDDTCPLKPLKRYKCCSIGLMVKSSIVPTWPVFAISRASWAREAPRPSQPSQIVAIKEE